MIFFSYLTLDFGHEGLKRNERMRKKEKEYYLLFERKFLTFYGMVESNFHSTIISIMYCNARVEKGLALKRVPSPNS